MLVLSRKRGEKIVIPQCALSVTVVDVQGNAVRLGISAPPEVAVHREELWREIAAEDSAAPQPTVAQHSLDAFATELGDAAQRIAQRHGLADAWIDSEQGLSRALAATVQNWGRRFAQPAENSERPMSVSETARLPR